MKRFYESAFFEHFEKNRQMLLIVGPRQVGKTTIGIDLISKRQRHYYLNWDDHKDRRLIAQGSDAIAAYIKLEEHSGEDLPILIFDELHKYRKWKNFLKGFFDRYSKKVQILVIGSARLDIYKSVGDSLMGRYFLYCIHPISVAEVLGLPERETDIAPFSHPIPNDDLDALLNFGGFPAPFLRRDQRYYNQWKRLRFQQLFSEDIRDLTRVQDIGQMQILAEILQEQAGCLTNFQSLANKVNVSNDTIKRWIQTLKSFYYCFAIRPWTKNITRSLLKEPKIYLWDWSLAQNEGARKENFIASHLLKAIHFWTDHGLGDYRLHFLRDKEQREVDFLVTKNKKPFFLVEVKSSAHSGISKSLHYFQKATGAPHAFQVSFDLPYIDGNCFSHHEPTVVPVASFLSQLI